MPPWCSGFGSISVPAAASSRCHGVTGPRGMAPWSWTLTAPGVIDPPGIESQRSEPLTNARITPATAPRKEQAHKVPTIGGGKLKTRVPKATVTHSLVRRPAGTRGGWQCHGLFIASQPFRERYGEVDAAPQRTPADHAAVTLMTLGVVWHRRGPFAPTVCTRRGGPSPARVARRKGCRPAKSVLLLRSLSAEPDWRW